MYVIWCFLVSGKIYFSVLDDCQKTFTLKAVCKNEVKIILYYYWNLIFYYLLTYVLGSTII